MHETFTTKKLFSLQSTNWSSTIIMSLLIMLLAFFIAVPAFAETSFSIMDAKDTGVSESGTATGTVGKTFNESAKKETLELSYSLSVGSFLEAWTKGYPAGLGAESVNTIDVGVDVPAFAQVDQITVKMVIKGTKAAQEIPLALQPFWNTFTETIDWKTVGDLQEIVFVVTPKGEKSSAGKLFFDLGFSYIASSASTVPVASSQNYGIITTGSAQGTVTTIHSDTAGGSVLELNYSLTTGSVLDVWTKELEPDLGPESVDTAQIKINVPNFDQVNQVAVTVLLKGTKSTQEVPVTIQPFWNTYSEKIDWETIGTLEEIVYAVSPREGIESVKGRLNFTIHMVDASSSLKMAGIPDETAQAASVTETAAVAKGVESAFTIMNAQEYGGFNIGPAGGDAYPVTDKTLGKDVLEFSYWAERGATVGLWTKTYPDELNASTVDAVRMGVKLLSPQQAKEVAVIIELKGSDDVQKIPMVLNAGWNYVNETVDWNRIGRLQEAVFVVSPSAELDSVEGEFYADAEFYKLSWMEKYFTLVKAGSVLLAGLLMALLALILGGLFTRKEDDGKVRGIFAHTTTSFVASIRRDLFYAIVAVLIVGTSLWIYSLGTLSALDAGISFSFLAIAILGVVIAQVLKYGYIGKWLTPSQVFQNLVLTGLLAAASSRTELLQAPSTWMQLLVLSKVTAALFFCIYHIYNAYSLSSSGKHVRGLTGTLFVATPFLFGWLLMVENSNLMGQVGNFLTGGLLSASPDIITAVGRLLIMFVFNEIIVNAFSLVFKGKYIKKAKVHVMILGVSAGVVIAPIIAGLGSTATVAALPILDRALIAILTTALAFAGLWGEVYLITGILLDSGKRLAPTKKNIPTHIVLGVKKGLTYAAIVMAFLFLIAMGLQTKVFADAAMGYPLLLGALAGALVFPLLKTIIESFDGSQPFFSRLVFSYKNLTLYLRGAVVGLGFAYMLSEGLFQKSLGERIKFGVIIGFVASGGISILRDFLRMIRGVGKIQSMKMYFVDSILGVFVGAAVSFYLDARQVPVIIAKFKLYTTAGFSAVEYITYPLVNKWGKIDLGTYTGGSKLMFLESLAGVINWSIAAWLFAVNKVFLQAVLDKDKSPIKFFFSKEGFAQLMEHMIFVLRWGLWMSPIIFTFLRMMPDPTWYNQDGAIRTMFAIYKNATLSPEAFRAWSLNFFVYIMAFDFLRILIWMDHMGLRVATLVNLSFLGLDKLDEKVAKFIGPAVAQRYIPEGVKRFCTWAPLIIPFYLPRGKDWEYAWGTAEAIQKASRGGIIGFLQSRSLPEMLLLLAVSIIAATGLSHLIRNLYGKYRASHLKKNELNNRRYKVVVKENGEVYSEVLHLRKDVYPPEFDVTRRSYDIIDPAGRILFLVDENEKNESGNRFWPVTGNFPAEKFTPSRIEKDADTVYLINENNGIKSTVAISLPDRNSTAEIWNVTIENMTDKQRNIKCVPYLEWVLNGGLHDRFHTQYARLFPEMEYIEGVNTIVAWQRGVKSMGFLAVDEAPEGFMTNRMDFIGRARSIWSPLILDNLNFREPKDTAKHPTFDPIGSMMVNASLAPKGSKSVRFMMGFGNDKERALYLIHKHLKPQKGSIVEKVKNPAPVIGHGQIPEGTPQPYYEFSADGNKLIVNTPFTPRPFDHGMSNKLHSVMVTNRGLHTSCNGNSQQNRLTPDWPDTVTKEVPAEGIYMYDPEDNEWYSPTYHPYNTIGDAYRVEFSVDGTAVFHKTEKSIQTELTVFVPPEEPTGIYMLKIKNTSNKPKKMRIAPFFQMVLEFQPERSGKLQKRYDEKLQTLFMENPRNMFRKGCAFVGSTMKPECVETKRGRFFGSGRWVEHPYLVEKGEPDITQKTDDRQIASFLGTVEIPANGEQTVAFTLGQADTRKEAIAVATKFQTVEAVKKSLEETRKWWLSLVGTLNLKTNQVDFDNLQNWLKYQALAERIWARRGFYQTSGAFGFRDQLQDTVNLIWVDPALARKQILLHSRHQFLKGDVFHWFFTLTDGRTAFSCRSHASDNPIWLSWSVVEYLSRTGDMSILDEKTSYVSAEFPFAKLPKNKHGWGTIYHRTTREETLYRHSMRSIDLVLEERTGKNGLPLIQTGDWNDGLDEIGSQGEGESVWLGFFLYYIMKNYMHVIEERESKRKAKYYKMRMEKLKDALEATWRNDRYLRAYHDNKKGIGIEGSGTWETDALTAAWAVMCGINPEREVTVFHTALRVLERENTVLLGWPALREDSKPYLGRSSKYPEGVRENGMYCHGVQWLIRAARILAERFDKKGDSQRASEYRSIAYRLWLKITPVGHTQGTEIENYGGMPNKQPADILTTFDVGRMIWHGYTGAAGWLLRQACESVVGASLVNNELVLPDDLGKPRGELKITLLERDIKKSPIKNGEARKKRGKSELDSLESDVTETSNVEQDNITTSAK